MVRFGDAFIIGVGGRWDYGLRVERDGFFLGKLEGWVGVCVYVRVYCLFCYGGCGCVFIRRRIDFR